MIQADDWDYILRLCQNPQDIEVVLRLKRRLAEAEYTANEAKSYADLIINYADGSYETKMLPKLLDGFDISFDKPISIRRLALANCRTIVDVPRYIPRVGDRVRGYDFVGFREEYFYGDVIYVDKDQARVLVKHGNYGSQLPACVMIIRPPGDITPIPRVDLG